jgi:hypothetical protein
MLLAIFNHLLNHCLFRNVQALQFGIINPYPFACLDSLFNVGAAEPLDFLLVNLSAPKRFSAVRANQHST